MSGTEQENAAAAAAEQEITLEEAFAQVETILKHMEQSDISLSDSFAEYERGVALLKQCNAQIDRIEKQMIILRGGAETAEEE